MSKQTTRREVLQGGVALAGLGVFGVPEWAFPALAQGEELVEFTDLPEEIVLARTPDRRIIDVRNIDGPLTPADQWFTTQHYGHPDVDPDTYRLKVSGMVNSTLNLSLGRPPGDAEPGAGVRVRVLGQPGSVERAVEQRELDRRPAAGGPRAGGPAWIAPARSSSSGPITARKR